MLSYTAPHLTLRKEERAFLPLETMKKFLSKFTATIFILLSLILISACGKEKPKDKNPPPPDSLSEENIVAGVNELLKSIKDSYAASENISADDFMVLLKDYDFSISDFYSGSEREDALQYVVFKDNVLYISGKEIQENGISTDASYITKLYDSGIVFLNTITGKTVSQTLPLDTLMQKYDLTSLLDTLEMSEDDLIETDNPTQFYVSDDYLSKFINVLVSFEKENDKFSDNSFSDMSCVLDVTDYQSEKVILITLSSPKNENLISIKFDADELESGKDKLAISISSTDFTLTVSISNNELISMNLYTKNEQLELHFNFSISDQSSPENTQQCVLLNAEMSISTKDNAKISAITDLTIQLAEDGAAQTIAGRIELKNHDDILISGEIQYNRSAFSVLGGTGFVAELQLAEEQAHKTLCITVETEQYSKDSSKYKLTVDIIDNGVTESNFATISIPSAIEPVLSDTEKEYLRRSDIIFENYNDCLEVSEQLTSQVNSLIKKGYANKLFTKSYTVDKATGLIYFTDISIQENKYYVKTYCVPDYENYLYFYAENLGDFLNFTPSKAYLDSISMVNIIKATVPTDYVIQNHGTYWTYYYLEQAGQYVAIRGYDASTAVFFTQPPTESMFAGYSLHELIIDGENDVIIHDFDVTYGASCEKIYTCKDCDFTISSISPEHLNTDPKEKVENGEILWHFSICERCKLATLDLYNTGNCSVTVLLERVNENVLSDIRIYEELKNYQITDAEHSLVIKEITYNFDDSHTIQPVTIEIPALSEICGYKIIGVIEGFSSIITIEDCTLILPEDVEFIYDNAFYNDPYEKIILPNSLLYIGKNAFESCFNLEELTIPEKVLVMDAVFGDMMNLKKLIINAEFLKEIPYINAPNLELLQINSTVESFIGFSQCKITEFVIPEGITTLEEGFSGNTTLIKIILPSTMKTIGEGAFRNCTALREIVLNEALKEIGGFAFEDCKALEKIWVDNGTSSQHEIGKLSLPSDLEKIGAYAFSGCSKLQSAEIPSGISVISAGLFNLCTSLKSVKLPDGITEINVYAFAQCSSLEDIVIPPTVKTIGEHAFEGCGLLRDEALGFGDALTYIGYCAFSNCSNLKNVVIPKNVVHFDNPFDNCTLDKLQFDCVYSFGMISHNPTTEITYTNAITAPIMYGKIINIYSSELPERQTISQIAPYVTVINFAGSMEELTKAGYAWSENTTINCNAAFN